MIIVNENDHIPSLTPPYCLTIGSFDGVHRGHQKLIERMRAVCSGTLAVYTFRNHPSEIFTPTPLIYPLSQKLQLLEKAGIDLVLLNTFTPALANLSYHDFIIAVRNRFPFSYLVLGANATFGRAKLGTETKIKDLAQKLKFQVEYLPKTYMNDKEISSRKIRSIIEQGNLEKASFLLGRPYSLLLHFPSQPNEDGYMLNIQGLCLPPAKKYPVLLLFEDKNIKTILEVRKEEKKLLALINTQQLSGKEVEIVFQ